MGDNTKFTQNYEYCNTHTQRWILFLIIHTIKFYYPVELKHFNTQKTKVAKCRVRLKILILMHFIFTNFSQVAKLHSCENLHLQGILKKSSFSVHSLHAVLSCFTFSFRDCVILAGAERHVHIWYSTVRFTGRRMENTCSECFSLELAEVGIHMVSKI